jgi:formyltetrahydrofolate synthetase
MTKSVIVKSHSRRPRKSTVWKSGGRGNMKAVHVPKAISADIYEIALALDNMANLEDKLAEIAKILNEE